MNQNKCSKTKCLNFNLSIQLPSKDIINGVSNVEQNNESDSSLWDIGDGAAFLVFRNKKELIKGINKLKEILECQKCTISGVHINLDDEIDYSISTIPGFTCFSDYVEGWYDAGDIVVFTNSTMDRGEVEVWFGRDVNV